MTHTPCSGFSKHKKIGLNTPNNRAPLHSASSNSRKSTKKDRSVSKHKERSPSPFKVKDSVNRSTKRCKSTEKRRDKKLAPLAKKFLDLPYTVLDTIGGFLGQEIPIFIYCQRILAKKYLLSKKEEYSLQMGMISEQIDDLVRNVSEARNRRKP